MHDSQCPTCKMTLDCHIPDDGREEGPKPEDLSVCMHCGELLVFNQDLTQRVMPASVFLDLDGEHQIKMIIARKMAKE